MVNSDKFVINLDKIESMHQHYLGQHNSHLADLKASNFLIPDGFVVTPDAYFEFLEQNRFLTKLSHLINAIDFENSDSIQKVSKNIKKILKSGKIPRDVAKQIISEYEALKNPKVRLFASIISGNLGQNDIPLSAFEDEIAGESVLIHDIRGSWTKLFDPDFLVFRNENNMDQTKSGMSISVQKILESSLSGKLSTVDLENNDRSKIVIDIDGQHGIVVDKTSGGASKKINKSIPQVFIDGKDVSSASLSKDLTQKLIDLAISLQIKHLFPQEIKWAIENDQIYILGVKEISLYGKN